jgi:hydrogenase maturation protease
LTARIIGIGQPMAGDDGVGIAVARRVCEICERSDVQVMELAEPSALVPLLADGANPVVLIDAIVGSGKPGRVLHFAPLLGRRCARLLSSHGVGVRDAVELAKTLEPDAVAENINIVAVTIQRPSHYGDVLSPAVAAVIEQAAAFALWLVGS